MEYAACYPPFKKKEVLSDAVTCINLEGTVLSEISYSPNDKHYTCHFH